jgi:hypothetical protein
MDCDDFKKEANDFVRYLVETGNASLSTAYLTDECRSELKIGLHNLESGFREITKILDDIGRAGRTGAATAEFGFDRVWRALAGAYIIGGGEVTDSHKNFLVREPASGGGKKGGATRKARAEVWHVKARDLLPDVEKNNPGLSPKKLAPLVISLCSTKIGVDAMAKFIRTEREARK